MNSYKMCICKAFQMLDQNGVGQWIRSWCWLMLLLHLLMKCCFICLVLSVSAVCWHNIYETSPFHCGRVWLTLTTSCLWGPTSCCWKCAPSIRLKVPHPNTCSSANWDCPTGSGSQEINGALSQAWSTCLCKHKQSDQLVSPRLLPLTPSSTRCIHVHRQLAGFASVFDWTQDPLGRRTVANVAAQPRPSSKQGRSQWMEAGEPGRGKLCCC